MTDTSDIPGYDYGSETVADSPVSGDQLQLLLDTVMFDDDDRQALRQAGEVLTEHADELLDVWYDFVSSHDHLVAHFSSPEGEPLGDYLDRVRDRFGQWIDDTCNRDWDQTWLDYQHEIGLRHHETKKNVTDDVDSTPQIPMRYLTAFIVPITATVRPFLARSGASDEQVDAMYHAWLKAVTVQVTLWCHPYAEADW
ncbi:MAG: protoglobin domain-containing protein [Actinomycetota bacterium]|nr:protoglobin domain-containing protein [Actinomycetota bacterium]